jgi:hypothetical protein
MPVKPKIQPQSSPFNDAHHDSNSEFERNSSVKSAAEPTPTKKTYPTHFGPERSVFWIVSTHIVTTAVLMPALAAFIWFAIVRSSQLPPLFALLLLPILTALGYIGGAYHSVSLIRKATPISQPENCIKYSVVTFTILSILCLIWNAYKLFSQTPRVSNPVIGTGLYFMFYVGVCIAFSKITRLGFSRK